jgi:hypothetical protein
MPLLFFGFGFYFLLFGFGMKLCFEFTVSKKNYLKKKPLNKKAVAVFVGGKKRTSKYCEM